MRAKFFREHNRFPSELHDEEYMHDTRFFAAKQTKKDVAPLQELVDQLTLTGQTIPVTAPRQLP